MKCEHVRAAFRLQLENLCSRRLEPDEGPATQKRAKHAAKEKEKSWQELTERVAKLKALRLAKEAADKEAAEQSVAEKAAAKKTRPLRSPQSH